MASKAFECCSSCRELLRHRLQEARESLTYAWKMVLDHKRWNPDTTPPPKGIQNGFDAIAKLLEEFDVNNK